MRKGSVDSSDGFPPRSPRYGIFPVARTSSAFSDKSIALKHTGSGMRKVLGAFSSIPPKQSWLRSGIVERQMVSTDTLWLPRLMILTSDAIIFTKAGVDVVLDRFPLTNVTFVGKVNIQIRYRISANQNLTYFRQYFFVRLIELRMHFLVRIFQIQYSTSVEMAAIL